MEVTNISVHNLSIDEVESGMADTTQDLCIIEVETDEGITGVGEAESSPQVTKAIVNAPTSHSIVTGLEEIVIGRDPFNVDVIWNDMFERTYYYGRKGAVLSAMSAIDMALWDIMGKEKDVPIYKLLGGKHREKVRAYMSTLFPQDPTNTDYMKSEAKKVLENDYTAVKFGWGGFGQDRQHDRELISAARAELGESIDIMVDVGMVWDGDIKRAIKGVKELDSEFDIFWFEEPVKADNLKGYRQISESSATRIVGGEEEYTVYGFRNLIDHGKVDGVQPDVAKAGGFTQMQKIATLSDAEGIPLYVHGWSSEILTAANLQLIAANKNLPLIEYSLRESPLRFGIIEEDFVVEDGYISIPDRPGLGITLNQDTIEKYGK